MTQRTKTTLKTYFNTGDIPTETQFSDLIDSFSNGAVFDVRDYGAVGDGSADDTAPIQAAIDACEAVLVTGVGYGGVVFFPAGNYRITAELTITNAVMLQGVNRRSMIYLASATANAISAYHADGISFCGVRDLMINCRGGSNTRTAGKGIYFKKCGDYLIENVYIYNGWDAIYLENCSSGIVRNVSITGNLAAQSLNDGVTLISNCIANRLEHIAVSSAQAYHAGFRIESGTDTLTMYDCGSNLEAVYGLLFENTGAFHDPRWCYVTNCYFETSQTVDAVGIYIVDGGDIELLNCYTAHGQYGLSIISGRGIQISGGIYQLARQHGIVVEGGKDISIIGAGVTNNSQLTTSGYVGIVIVAGVSQFKIQNCRIGNYLWVGGESPWDSYAGKQSYGIQIQTGASDNYIITGNDLRGNNTGALSDGGTGTNKVISGNLPLTGSAYTVSNPSTDRAFDVAATSLNELAAVVGTLITDLKVAGAIG